MDLAFLRHGFARGGAAGLDYGLLVATLQGLQASSAAAAAAALARLAPHRADPTIADVLLAAPAWREAATMQRGSFNPDQADRVGKAVATQMTREFTFAF